MFGRPPSRLPLPVAFLLVPQFSMMSFASAMEPLRSANRMSGRTLYSWQILSPDGAPVSASNGIVIVPAGGIAEAARSAMLVVCAGTGGHLFADEAVFGWLRRLDRQGLISAACRWAAISWPAPGCSLAIAAPCIGRTSPPFARNFPISR